MTEHEKKRVRHQENIQTSTATSTLTISNTIRTCHAGLHVICDVITTLSSDVTDVIDVCVDEDVVDVTVTDGEASVLARLFRWEVVTVAITTSKPEATTGATVGVEIPLNRVVGAGTAFGRNETSRCAVGAEPRVATCARTCS